MRLPRGQQSLRGGEMNILNNKKIFCSQEILYFKNLCAGA